MKPPIVTIGPQLYLLVTTRYDVTLTRAMPHRLSEQVFRWKWTLRVDTLTVDTGFTVTERGAERQAKRAARRHHHRPPARHTAPRTYSINL